MAKFPFEIMICPFLRDMYDILYAIQNSNCHNMNISNHLFCCLEGELLTLY